MENKYLIASIGRKVSTEDIGDEPTFIYKSLQYIQLIIWNQFHQILEIKSDTGFLIKPFLNIDTNKEYLNLYYDANQKCTSETNHKHKSKLINVFFEIVTEIDETNIEGIIPKEPTINEFYEALKRSHENDDFTGITECVQHPSLKPILRPYQVHGVRWMLKRELKDEYVDQKCVKMKIKYLESNQIFYYNNYSNELYDAPQKQLLPKGSLLCDEMGLGKTVEMLDLILMNPRRNLKRKHDPEREQELDTLICNTEISTGSIEEKLKLKCICGKTSKSNNKLLLTCSKCKNFQHEDCVNKNKDQLTTYICPNCWKLSDTIIDSGCTIIVTPSTLKHQWKDEIEKHISKVNFKVLMYEGLSKGGWISPMELKDYDVIITDYKTLQSELYYFESQSKNLRQQKKFVYPPCPLVSIKWWRVVIDEAQVVENITNRCSKMVKVLQANYRWGITGTPIEKDSIVCLSGLLYFIDYVPYSNSKVFDQLWKEYKNGNHNQFITALSHVMWRTSKKDVEAEINIPKQTEIMHYIEMTDLQRFYYKSVHEQTQPIFQQNVRNYLSREKIYDEQTQEYINDPSLLDTNFYKLNNSTLRVFLEPLRKLRQDSTIPNLLLQNSEKQTLRPEQLAEHLITKTSIECKSALRTICSSLNGVAGLMIADEKYEEAVKLYKNVIQMSKDYTGVVCVDSMLQIHVYHNLLYINEITNNEEEYKNKQHYMEEIDKLEWKYIGNYYDKVKEIDLEIVEQIDASKKACKKLTDKTGEWWRYIIYDKCRRGEDQRILDLVNIEIDGVEHDNSTKRFTSIQGMDYVLVEWFEKLLDYHKKIEQMFSNLEFISKKLKPANEMATEDQKKVSALAVSALNCHLNLLLDKNKVATLELCVLCELQIKLNEYECLLFDKVLTNDANEGTWNARFEEKILKTLYAFAKRQDHIDLEMGAYFFKYLESLKNQFKLKSKLWMEINYTVSALDELNMCKMRLEVVEQSELTKEEIQNNSKISRLQIGEQMQQFQSQKQEAEVNFVRLNGRLKYLKYLKENNDPKECPICEQLPKERYYVLDCGHHLCFNCWKMMAAKNPNRMTCPICRADQRTKNIFAVNCLPHDSKLVGSYSPKIDEIIKSLIQLKKDEPNVKILIFSHWDTILSAIKPGLSANDIKHIHSHNLAKFHQEIKAFKLEDFTCLLINLKFAGKGLNFIEATHVFLVEPILNPDDEMQAVGRIHRIGQKRLTFVHRFITKKTIEENIYDKIIKGNDKWLSKDFTIRDIQKLLDIKWSEDHEEQESLF
ncbi:unnamed protein product [Diamesa serratosioi]